MKNEVWYHSVLTNPNHDFRDEEREVRERSHLTRNSNYVRMESEWGRNLSQEEMGR